MRARVIGIGQSMAGDDGVGCAVLHRLREMAVPADVELVEATDPSAVIPLLDGVDQVVLVDAVVGGPTPGDVLRLMPEALQTSEVTALSTHGVGVTDAIALARTIAPETTCDRIILVGVCIIGAQPYRTTLSPEVAAAVPRAAEMVLEIVGVHARGG